MKKLALYEYLGYVIKQSPHELKGTIWELYKDGVLVAWDFNKKAIEQAAEWRLKNQIYY